MLAFLRGRQTSLIKAQSAALQLNPTADVASPFAVNGCHVFSTYGEKWLKMKLCDMTPVTVSLLRREGL